ncbi:MAG: dipeptide epimerase [Culturomica sp.]|jgi:L-alanine-DL-glutamate epimerase-like enolase superfamily enzyme|nr:dipeptide epimerase [Culturomica sp.]
MKLSFKPYQLTLQHVFTVSGNSRTFTPDVLVEIEHEGIVGYGESSMPPYLGETTESVVAFLSKVDIEQFKNPFDTDEILGYVDTVADGNTAAKASIDIALHDLIGKLSGEPLHKMWHLDASSTPFTSYTIGIDTEEMVMKKTLEAGDKFRILKVKLGSDRDKDLIRAIRKVSHLPLTVDANQGWHDKYVALEMLHWLTDQNVVMVEQPMPVHMIEEQAWLLQKTPLPLFADESVRRFTDLEKIAELFSGVNIKLMKCTGLAEARRMITFARELGMQTMLGCMTETSCAVSAAAQLSPLVDFADLDGNLLITNDPFDGMKIVNGRITLNNLAGIGVERKLF